MWDQLSDDFIIAGLIVLGVILPGLIAALLALAEMKRERKEWI